MNKKIQFILLLSFISIQLIAQNNDINLLIKKEASLNAHYFLSLIPIGREKEYGFSNRDDFSKIKIEEPYKTYYVSKKDNKLWLNAGNEWRVPISVNGEYLSLLTIQINNGNPEIVDLGGNLLAHKIQEFEKINSNETVDQNVIIRNTFLNKDYMTTKFSSISLENKSISNLYEININTTQFIYQINENLPIKTSITAFYNATMNLINNNK
jgi:hypothetical protein